MKKYFIQHNNGLITTSDWPIKETKILEDGTTESKVSLAFEVDEKDVAKVNDGVKDWVIIDGKLSLKNSTRKSDIEAQKLAAEQEALNLKQRKLELIEKVTSGVATKEEQTEFANLI